MTYDQGEKAQQLGTLARIMRPTWNNLQQPPTEFIKNLQSWRDEIFNYENSVSEIASAMKMALLMQHIQGVIKSHLLLNVNLAAADFDDAATKVEDYYSTVYIDNNNPGGIQAFEKGGKPWKGKGSENQPPQQPQQPYRPWKGKGGKYGQRPYYSKSKGEGKGYYNYTNYTRPKGGYYNYRKSKGKGKGGISQGPPLPSNPYSKGKGSKGKGRKRTDIVCYYCGKPGHTSDKCWWKGQIYNIDQSKPVWSVPNDNQPQQLQQLPQSSASTTIMTQPQQTRLENMSLYESGSFYTGIHSITGATLIVNKDNTTTDQLRRWAILIDTGAMTTVGSQEHFNHIPTKPLLQQDP
eukprot:2313869-Amphidinium_carterae.2